MKKTIFTLLMSFSILQIIAADIYVNGSGNANTYTTIQEAVDSAASGDNIYVATVGTYSENVTISNKTLFIMAAVADEQFTLSGAFTLNPGSGNEVTIIGMYNGNIDVQTYSYGTINLISCFISSIDADTYGSLKVNVYDCEVSNDFFISSGSVKGCTILGELNINNSNGAASDTIRIMGNYLEDRIYWNSNTCYFEICNNFIKMNNNSQSYAVYIQSMQTTPGGTNLIANNTIENDQSTVYYQQVYGIFFNSITDGQNLVIVNNYITITAYNTNYSNSAIYSNSNTSNALLANNYWNAYAGFSYGFSNSSLVDNGTSSVTWSYSSNTGIISSSSAVNAGLDLIEYRDIDDTRNDIGTGGGPHAWSNYNTSTGKAAIFNLELPFQLYIGGNHNIKAKGFHKN